MKLNFATSLFVFNKLFDTISNNTYNTFMKKQKTLLLIIFFFFSSCISKSEDTILVHIPTEPVVIYTPTEVYRPSSVNSQTLQTAWSYLVEGDKWTKFTQNAIRDYGQSLLRIVPSDIKTYCPKYSRLTNRGRGDFWVQLISKLAYFESSYNPKESYTERFTDNDGNKVVSRGLLQLSIESANGNYACGLNNAEELHDPKTNLECAVRIFNTLIPRYGVIRKEGNSEWFGLARYWSPFRNERNEELVKYTSSLDICQ